MESFVTGLVKEWPDEHCAGVFAAGLGENPRQIKRAVNVFLLLSALAQERFEKLQGRIKPVRLAKIVVIQNVYPELYEVLKRTPRLLRELEVYYRSETSAADKEMRLSEGETEAGIRRSDPPPALSPFINRTAVRRILTMHPAEMPEANFVELALDELRLYFTLTRRAETPQPVQVETPRKFFEPQMVTVPAGSFLMGSTDAQFEAAIRDGLRKDWAELERPQHSLELPEFAIGKYPVTNLEYQAFIQDAGHPSPQHWNGRDYPEDLGDHPVGNVTWDDAMAYCNWLAEKSGKEYTLPSEAEWEKAARGADGRIYPWGDEFDPAKCNTREGGGGGTTPVGQFSPQGDSPYGCADMAGNVWEWTLSNFKEYPYRGEDGREEVNNRDQRVLRGGSFLDLRRGARCACRNRLIPDSRSWYYGFRVVVSPSSRQAE